MAWQRRTWGLLAAIVLGGAGMGCAGGPSAPAQVAVSAAETPAVSRFQKAEQEPAPPPTEPAGPPDGQFSVRVRAKVNGVAILDEELKSAVYPLLMELRDKPEPQRSALQKEVLEKALENLIERELVLGTAISKLNVSEAGQKILEKLKASAHKEFDKQVVAMKKRAGSKTDEDFKRLLVQQGQSLEGMRRQYERMFLATEYMRYLILGVTDKIGLPDAREYYDQHPNEFQTYDSVKWQDIFIAAERHGGMEGARQFATDLLARARAGADFAQLARQHDEGVSLFRNGEGYGQRRGEINPAEAEPYLFQLNDGQIGPLVELPSGIHLIRLVKRERAGLMPFDEKTQSFILNKLKGEAAERERKRIIKEFKRKAIIERDLSP
jgi:parvulin-like peptidyl-prolyl isomerase